MLGEGWLPAAAFLLERGALQLLMSALGRCLPFKTHLVVQVIALALMLRSNVTLCQLECANPAVKQTYSDLVQQLDNTMSKLLPVTVASRKDSPTAHPCLLLNSWFQAMLGLVVPSLYIDWAEERQKLRARQRRPPPRDTPDFLAPQPLWAATVQVALLAASLPVTWRAVALVDWWATTLLGARPDLV